MALPGDLLVLEPTGQLAVVLADAGAAEQKMNVGQATMDQAGGEGKIFVVFIGMKPTEQPDQWNVAGNAQLSANIVPGDRIGPKYRGVETRWLDHARSARVSYRAWAWLLLCCVADKNRLSGNPTRQSGAAAIRSTPSSRLASGTCSVLCRMFQTTGIPTMASRQAADQIRMVEPRHDDVGPATGQLLGQLHDDARQRKAPRHAERLDVDALLDEWSFECPAIQQRHD